jgi:hypothetical protein
MASGKRMTSLSGTNLAVIRFSYYSYDCCIVLPSIGKNLLPPILERTSLLLFTDNNSFFSCSGRWEKCDISGGFIAQIKTNKIAELGDNLRINLRRLENPDRRFYLKSVVNIHFDKTILHCHVYASSFE